MGASAAQSEIASPTAFTICFNYGCREQAVIVVDEMDRAVIGELFVEVTDPASERRVLASAIARLYLIAASQSPIWRDRGGNAGDDDTEDGRMDCVDHATNTTAFLRWLAAEGWLRHHTVLPPVWRGWMFSGHSAAAAYDRVSDEAFVLDSWFFDPGVAPMIASLRDWSAGSRPEHTTIWSSGWSGAVTSSRELGGNGH